MDDGAQTIDDDAILAQVRKQAQKVNRDTLIYGALLTVAFVAVPFVLFGV